MRVPVSVIVGIVVLAIVLVVLAHAG